MFEIQATILAADDEESVRNLLKKVITKMGYTVHTAANGEEVLNKVKQEHYDLIIMDIRMPKLDGMEAFKILRLEYPRLPIIMMTAFGTVETTLETMRLGAFDYLTKPFDVSQIKSLVEKAIASQSASSETKTQETIPPPLQAFVGTSLSMQEVFKTIGRVSASNSSVLIQGESGTGKELVANTIHRYSSRKNGLFVTVNCGAVPEGILESEFFGHEKGAFTGAFTRKAGKFEYADGGTIFLDEIGEMSPALQVKLLRVLQEQEFERVGSNEKISVDVRIIAATNKNLRQSVADKTFRADLFYRLNVVSIIIPPLRERKEDIPLLAAYFRDRYCAKLGVEARQIPQEAMNVLTAYEWPGNVRELENAIEHAIVMGSGQVIHVDDLPVDICFNVQQASRQASNQPLELSTQDHNKPVTLREMVKAVEKEAIARTLDKTGGNKLQTAKILDISRRALQYKIEEYGLNEDD